MYEEREPRGNGLGIAIAGAFGLAAGLLAGMIAGTLLGGRDSAQVSRVVRKLGRRDHSQGEPDENWAHLLKDLTELLNTHPATRSCDIVLKTTGKRRIELSGWAPDAGTKALAADLVRRTKGVDTVVNRITVGDELDRDDAETA